MTARNFFSRPLRALSAAVLALAAGAVIAHGDVVPQAVDTSSLKPVQSLNLPLEDKLLAALTKAGWNHRSAPVFIQSFEQSNLKALSRKTSVRLMQLVDADDVNVDGTLAYNPPFDRPYDWTISGKPELLERTFGWFATDAGLDDVASYAYGIGPWKRYIVSTLADPNGSGPGEAARSSHRQTT